MSWQELIEVTAVNSALTFCKRGVPEAETVIAAPLGPLGWGDLWYHTTVDMFMITPIMPDLEAFEHWR